MKKELTEEKLAGVAGGTDPVIEVKIKTLEGDNDEYVIALTTAPEIPVSPTPTADEKRR